MFALWNANNSGNVSGSSIKEANEQLQAMNARIVDLEARIREQTELMERREGEHIMRFNQMKQHKEAEIRAVQTELMKANQKMANIDSMLKERDVQMAFLLHRCSYLDEAASYAPLLDQLSQCLKNAFISPPPKVQTVKPTPNPKIMMANQQVMANPNLQIKK